jgi:serine/threonine protein kinase
MMILDHCEYGNLRNYLNESNKYINYETKIDKLHQIARGLIDIHSAGKVHKDFHSGNILFSDLLPYIGDLGMCQPANNQIVKEEGVFGVLPYMAPEVLRGLQYTKAADIYSFGIIMNEFLSEEIPYNDIPHNQFLAIKICKGLRPKISKDVPKLLADLIVKCWDAEIENRPTTRELYQTLKKWYDEVGSVSDDSDDNEDNEDNENGADGQYSGIYFQVKVCNKIGRKQFKNRSNEDKSKNIQTHPQAIYTSRLLNFKNLPKPVNQFNSGNLSIFIMKSTLQY